MHIREHHWIDLQRKLEQIMKQAVTNGFVAGTSLLVIQDESETVFCKAGYADIEMGIPMERDTIFRLYSLSKPITGAAAMILMEQGIIDLYDPVSKYLPGFKNQMVAEGENRIPAKREVLIKDLLSMTSGMPYGGYPNKAGEEAGAVFDELDKRLYGTQPMTTQEIANRLGESSLSFQPGEKWQYGTSADILGAVIEIVSGEKLGDFLCKEIFEPLGMKDTGFFVPPMKQFRLAKIYEETEGQLQEYRTDFLGVMNQLSQPPAFESGGAGLASTLDDYARFALMLINGGSLEGKRVLSPQTVRFFTSGELLPHQEQSMWREWDYMAGYSYGNLMRVLKYPGMSYTSSVPGEYGWAGWTGTYFANIPSQKLTVLLGMQRKDAGTTALTRKLLNVIYSELL